MSFEALLRFGFPTASEAADAPQDSPLWLAGRLQVGLLDAIHRLVGDASKIDGDADLTPEAKIKRKAELARKTAAGIRGDPLDRLSVLIGTKHSQIAAAFEKAEHPTQTDGERIVAELRRQRMQDLLLRLQPTDLLHEIEGAMERRDPDVIEAVTTLPQFILDGKSITRQVVETARQEWRKAANPRLAQELADADKAVALARESIDQAVRAVEKFGGIERRVIMGMDGNILSIGQ